MQVYSCTFPGIINKGTLHCHLLSLLKVKTHWDLHSYWEGLQYWTMWAPCWQPPTADTMPSYCLQSGQVHHKFLHSWSCLVGFFSTPSRDRPASSSAAQNVARRNEFPAPPFYSPSSHKSSSPDFKETPERHSCCSISRTTASTNQENGFQVQTTLPSPFTLKSGDCFPL